MLQRRVETYLSVLRYVELKAVDSVLTCLLHQFLPSSLLVKLGIDWNSIPRLSERRHDVGGLTFVFTFYTPLETICWFTEYVLVYLCMNELESWD
jgi:hypothetical protein